GAGEPAAGGAGRVRRRPGRPRAMSPEQVERARRMHADGTRTVDEIAATLGVSRATVYRHLDPV
ncbi:helix-turn-helix domain-containing protein, partial [Micromonospora sp. CPCC 205561]|uniref:helix-turn-helix domain-containing protein n=1 Tax=Micromonospora sp. CPCC 205561 TaxID=3122407 RepID=UPI002FF33E01